MTEHAPCLVRTMGLIQSQPYHSTPLTKDGDVMLTLVVAGRGRCVSGQREREVSGGMVGLVGGDARGVLMSDLEYPYIHYYCRFAGGYARELAARIIAASPGPFRPWPGVLALSQRLHRHGRISRHQLPRRCGPEGLDVLAILEELADGTTGGSTCATEAASAGVAPEHRLRSHLFERVAEPTDVGAIAAALGISRSTLSRQARRMGTTVQRLHEQTKVEWAATLLRATDASVGEVGRRVGYHDQFYFSRVFRKHYGCPPRAYRARFS
ncbi:MAG: helix-turn-helix domain-containing protein [Spirochaetota bacterium]